MRVLTICLGAVLCAGLYAAVSKSRPQAAASTSRPLYEESRKDGIVKVKAGDRAIGEARAQAQATLGPFLALARDPKPGQGNFAVKVAFGGKTGPREFIWITRFRFDGDGGTGTVDNRPAFVPDLQVGQVVTFRREEVVDWMYREGPVVKGNFTGCAILATASEADRAAFKQKMGLDCEAQRI